MVELIKESKITVNKSVIQILREAVVSGEFDDVKKYWSVNLDLD